MKVCLVYPGFPPNEALGGGISTLAFELACALAEGGCSVTVLSRVGGQGPARHRVVAKRIDVYDLPGRASSPMGGAPEYDGDALASFSTRVWAILTAIEDKRGPFDVIEFSDWGAEAHVAVERSPSRTVIRCSTPAFVAEAYNPLNPPYLSEAVKDLEKATLRRAQHLVCSSDALMCRIDRELGRSVPYVKQKPPLNIAAIPAKSTYTLAFSSDRPMRILAAGRVEERKGMDVLLQSLSLLEGRSIHCATTIVGGATPCRSGEDTIQRFQRRPPSNLEFTGASPRSTLLDRYQRYDLFVMPSRFDSFGYVGAEAMAAGVPTILTDACGLADYCAAGAYVVRGGDATMLADRIEGIYRRYSEAVRIGQRGQREISAQFSGTRVARNIIAYYRAITQRA